MTKLNEDIITRLINDYNPLGERIVDIHIYANDLQADCICIDNYHNVIDYTISVCDVNKVIIYSSIMSGDLSNKKGYVKEVK